MTERYSVSSLQQGNNPPPKTLDYLEFSANGVTLRVYGILHGITGGLNREYVEFITHAISSTAGCKLAEKGMKQLYRGCGIDDELEDWLVLRPIDCLVMGFQLIADPRCLWMITIDALRERVRQHDPYLRNKRKNQTDLGESPYFHYLDAFQRRGLIGFRPSQQAIANDLHSMSRWYGAILPKRRHIEIAHPQWRRILLLERLMHIPCRSLHMLHYAVAYANKHRLELVNLYVGETHNTDMHFLANHGDEFVASLGKREKNMLQRIIGRAVRFARQDRLTDKLALHFYKLRYLLFLITGAALSLLGYGAIWGWMVG